MAKRKKICAVQITRWSNSVAISGLYFYYSPRRVACIDTRVWSIHIAFPSPATDCRELKQGRHQKTMISLVA